MIKVIHNRLLYRVTLTFYLKNGSYDCDNDDSNSVEINTDRDA